jgi:hypothetical protein
MATLEFIGESGDEGGELEVEEEECGELGERGPALRGEEGKEALGETGMDERGMGMGLEAVDGVVKAVFAVM